MKRLQLLLAALIAVALFVLYAIFAAHDIMFGDGPELTMAAVENGLAGPPGYPLWVMLGHLASRLPVGSLAYRVNLTSCFYHALTIGVVFLSGLVLTSRRLPALFGALTLALTSPLFISWSLQAEVFPLNDLFAAAIVLLCLLLLENAYLYWGIFALGLLFGLGLANHHTIIFLAPLPVWIMFCQRKVWLRSMKFYRTLFSSIVVFIAAMAFPYLHILVVSQHSTQWSLGLARTPQELIDVFDRKIFGTFNLVPRADERGGNTWERMVAMLEANGWPTVVITIGCIGFALRKRFRELGIALVVMVFPFVLFCMISDIDVSNYLSRAILQRFGLLWMTAAAPFASGVYVFIDNLKPAFFASFFRRAALLSCLVFGFFLLPKLSLARTHGPRNLAQDIANALPRNAILETCGDAINGTLLYYRPIEKWRPDLAVIVHGYLGRQEYRTTLAQNVVLPDILDEDMPIAYSRDIIAFTINSAHLKRSFWVAGDRPIHVAGPRYYVLPEGIASIVVPLSKRLPLASRYRTEVALQSAPGFADISSDRWQSNGFGSVVRAYYAGGFFSTGYDAERLGDIANARYWYQRAQQYSDEPVIAERLNALGE